MSLVRKAIPTFSFALTIAFGLGCLSCGDCVERPSIVSITPASAVVGAPDLVLIVNGNDFQPNSTIDWNGAARTTTFVNGHQLKTTILSSDLAMPATVKVTVFSPPQVQTVTFGTTNSGSSALASLNADCAGGISNAHAFAVGP